MANHRWRDPADVPFEEFETRRRIAAVEQEFDQRWPAQARRPRRTRRWWRRSAGDAGRGG